jgi:hypothetical protein
VSLLGVFMTDTSISDSVQNYYGQVLKSSQDLMAKELTIPRNVRLGEKNNKALAKAPTLSPNCSVANNMGRVPHGINKVNKAASAIISDTPTFFGAISPAIANKVAE